MWRLAARLSPSAALPAQEGAHEETRLLGSIGMVRADRTGAPRPTSLPHTIGARCVFQMAGASRDIVGARREGAHGAGFRHQRPEHDLHGLGTTAGSDAASASRNPSAPR